ncbi:ABC transporter permease [Granulicella cerasi]|uniref:ABC transporter permease n=1 Tax=Granulicella cerasi TaxID=741063 RepID=A0ABW1ZB81_9BACT|nr:ABC transporter permease [Granulicella cerasi]
MKAIRRIFDAILTVWAVLTAVFFLTHLLGDPATLLLPVGASAVELKALRHELGLDLSLPQQYGHFLSQLCRGHMGESFLFARPALGVVVERLPATLQLAAAALVMALIFGCVAGSLMALRRGWWVSLIRALVVSAQATPVFLVGLASILLFAIHLRWLPAGGRGGALHLLLPALCMALFLGTQIARVVEYSVQGIAQEPYVLAARMKGLRAHTIFAWYIFRNALFPLLTLLGLLVGEMLGGAVVVETVFAWPGVGRLTFQALQNGDIPLVMAAVLLSCVGVVAANLIVDLLYIALDPRLRRAA